MKFFMIFDDSKIKQILIDENYVEAKDMEKAEEYAKEHRGSITEYLLEEDLLSRAILGQAIAESFGVPFSDLNANPPKKEQVLLIPENIAKKSRVIVCDQKENELIVSTDNPAQTDLKNILSRLFPNKKIIVSFAMPDEIDSLFANYHQGLGSSFAKIMESKGKVAPEIIDQIIEDALLLKASDIHCEPEEKSVIIRFRIDGVLHEAGEIPKEFYENIVNRLKVLAKLRIDEHFSAQDGAIRYSSSSHIAPIDLRISIVPTIDGEKIVMRILSSYVRNLTLTDIGLSEKLQEQIIKSAKKPFGMILVTGPTGSGKTTTLYSIIKLINTKSTNITTIEDPVEYKIQGVNQIQTNVQTNLTFAKGLRAVMRQDPNVIFVGEIRDIETADIAVNAALTGHLLLSTFHANNAATAIPRFIDMGVEPFLVGSTLELIIAQRLVRRICDSCKESYVVSKTDLKKFPKEISDKFEPEDVLYRGKGCESCSNTGFKGRVGVFEFLNSSPELQDLIAKSPSTKDVATLIKSQGFVSMLEDGIEKAKAGATTIEEVLRVVGT